jgi:hypothetical protein
VRLRALKVGGTFRYRKADWEAFLAALNPDREGAAAAAAGQDAAAKAATRRLDKRLGKG